MTEEKIKALIPSYITISKDLKKDKIHIAHNGKILTEQNAEDPGTQMEYKTLDCYMQGADKRFAQYSYVAGRITIKR